ncbi:MAG TPA: hypothetical protein VIH75_00165 [Candidatus Sulfotelmatobacter sp.]|jgi:uncharacterized membrane protein YesL
MTRWLKRAAQWFLISGCIGIVIAVALYILGSFSYTRHFAVHVSSVLCPEMILGLAEPTSPMAIALLLAFVFGTNFILYGIAGLILCGAWTWLRRGAVL